MLGQTAVADFVAQKFNQVTSNSLGSSISRVIGTRIIWAIALDNSNNLIGINGNGSL
jgi:hypothetical protein